MDFSGKDGTTKVQIPVHPWVISVNQILKYRSISSMYIVPPGDPRGLAHSYSPGVGFLLMSLLGGSGF